MPVITINGQVGSGVREMGPLIAQYLGVDYVDRLILAEAGRRVGASVAALSEKEQRVPPVRQRLTRLLKAALERSAATGGAGDPFFQPSVDALMVSPYPEASRNEPITHAQELDDQRFFDVVSQVIRDLAFDNNVVILGRASNLVLKDWPGALHVGGVAPMQYRIEMLMRREGVGKDAAEKMVLEQERSQMVYVRRFYKTEVLDPMNFHMIINVAALGTEAATRVVVEAVNQRARG